MSKSSAPKTAIKKPKTTKKVTELKAKVDKPKVEKKAPSAKAAPVKAPVAKAASVKSPVAKASTAKAPTTKAASTKKPIMDQGQAKQQYVIPESIISSSAHTKSQAKPTEISSTSSGSIVDWIEYRLPIFGFVAHLRDYQVPKNLSYWWSLGSIAGIALMVQIITGIVLAMHYTPHVDHAFNSVERIMRDVNYGWLIRYIHTVGASMFFVAIYLHIFRGLYYGSYKKPRELLWHLGIMIFLAMMATAFMGYVLPWGQMSYWGATVITNLFSAIPYIGDDIVTLLWGGFSVDNPTLNRFFALHYLLPFVILGLVGLHLVALHVHGSNNPKGIDVKPGKDTIPFHPYYTVKDFVGFGAYFLVFAFFIFYQPNYLGHPDNYIPANPMVTPAHIVPEWYFLPFYAILRAVPSKLGGVVLMISAILILFFLPWLDRSKVRSSSYRPWNSIAIYIFALDCILLGYVGGKPPEEPFLTISRLASVYYFFHFLILVPLISKYEKPIPLPKSLDE